VRAPHSADGLRQHRRFVHARQGRFSVPAPTKRRRFGDEQHGVAAPGRFEGWTERAGRRVHDHLPLAADRRLDFSDDRWCERLPVSSRPCGNRIGPASSLLDLPDRLGSLSDRIAHAEEPAAAVSVTELREDRHLLGPLEDHAPRRGVQDERYPAFPDGSAPCVLLCSSVSDTSAVPKAPFHPTRFLIHCATGAYAAPHRKARGPGPCTQTHSKRASGAKNRRLRL